MKHPSGFKIVDAMEAGANKMLLLAGPCVIESQSLCEEVAGKLKEVCANLDINFVFKASFDKANRTAVGSFRGPGLDKGLQILDSIRKNIDVPIVTDVHEVHQVQPASEVVDIIQIPAFLCRQTDLLVAAGQTGKTVNIKKGQYMAAADMQYAVNKVKSTGNNRVLLTERGNSFGYHNLVVDYRSLPVLRSFAPLIFDVTHSVQQPGGARGKSGGERHFAPYLARAAAAAGVDGFFIETHPNPQVALSDGPNMIPLDEMAAFLEPLLEIRKLGLT